MQKTIIIILISLICYATKGQDSLTYVLGNIAVVENGEAVRLNQQVPKEIPITKILNYKTGSAPLSTFLDKPCILIFWHQFCPTCRKELQTLETLKPELEGKVNILLVTFQSESSVTDFIAAQRKAGRHFSYPVAAEDTLLRKTFPHSGDPHLVWINTNSSVQAITDHLALTKENMQQWVSTGRINLPYKYFQRDFDIDKPLLVNNNGGPAGAFQYRSIITGFNDSLEPTQLLIRRNSSYTKIIMANATIDQMFKQLFIQMDTTAEFLNLDWMDKRVKIEYKSPSVTSNLNKAYEEGFESYVAFRKQNLYTYELILPNSYTEQEAMQCMLQDIERYFRIHASIENIDVNALALKLADNWKTDTTRRGETQIYKTDNDSTLVLRHNEIWSLVNVLNLNYDMPLVTDETGYKGKINIEMNFHERNLERVKGDLEKAKFLLKPEKLKVDMLILKDLQ